MKHISMTVARCLFNNGIEIYMLPPKAVIGNIWILPIGIHRDGTSFDAHVNAYRYYNCSAETGKRVHFYINE